MRRLMLDSRFGELALFAHFRFLFPVFFFFFLYFFFFYFSCQFALHRRNLAARYLLFQEH